MKTRVYVENYTDKHSIQELLFQWAFENMLELEYTIDKGFVEGDVEVVLSYGTLELSDYPRDICSVVEFIDLAVKVGALTKTKANKMLNKSRDFKYLYDSYKNNVTNEIDKKKLQEVYNETT